MIVETLVMCFLVINYHIDSRDQHTEGKACQQDVGLRFTVRRLKDGLEPSIQLATFKKDDTKTLCLHEEALTLLEDISKPVAILSICGPYRTGKSYFLSRVLGTTDAFKTSPTNNACTLGIWMATKVLDCGDFVVVLLDTEGTDAARGKQSSIYGDVKKSVILCTLISSYFIYNTLGAVKEEDLQRMR